MGWLDEQINFDGATNGDWLVETLEELIEEIRKLNNTLEGSKKNGV